MIELSMKTVTGNYPFQILLKMNYFKGEKNYIQKIKKNNGYNTHAQEKKKKREKKKKTDRI